MGYSGHCKPGEQDEVAGHDGADWVRWALVYFHGLTSPHPEDVAQGANARKNLRNLHSSFYICIRSNFVSTPPAEGQSRSTKSVGVAFVDNRNAIIP